MATTSFDTYKMVRRLREAGFNEEQAEALTDLVRETREADLAVVATKADLANLATKADIGELRAEVLSELGVLRRDISDHKAWTHGELGVLRADIAGVEARVIKWLVPLLIGQGAVVVALIRLL